MRQIIAIGGGGFGRNTGVHKIEQYILDQSNKSVPKICFIPTASAESSEYIDKYYEVFDRLKCTPSHLHFFKRTPNLDEVFSDNDIFFVGGGNTKSMLAVWQDWGVDKLLYDAYKSGKVMSGVSAGAICWFNQGVTDSWDHELKLIDCLNFVPGNCCPHYDEEPERIPYTHQFLKEEKIRSIFCIEGGSALHFIDEKPHINVQFHKDKHSYLATYSDGDIKESKFTNLYLS
tara:strand:- start:20451 stop:21143 length:693 start_codon:yes stop_codon:yes gene_type:complete